ncbi:hypothetical protein GJAV_G00198240 [Gymnothorax javanicus]|nr:hypothetical protein GJAV_G00198240 [Gymnothorax javanicus]
MEQRTREVKRKRPESCEEPEDSTSQWWTDLHVPQPTLHSHIFPLQKSLHTVPCAGLTNSIPPQGNPQYCIIFVYGCILTVRHFHAVLEVVAPSYLA